VNEKLRNCEDEQVMLVVIKEGLSGGAIKKSNNNLLFQ